MDSSNIPPIDDSDIPSIVSNFLDGHSVFSPAPPGKITKFDILRKQSLVYIYFLIEYVSFAYKLVQYTIKPVYNPKFVDAVDRWSLFRVALFYENGTPQLWSLLIGGR